MSLLPNYVDRRCLNRHKWTRRRGFVSSIGLLFILILIYFYFCTKFTSSKYKKYDEITVDDDDELIIDDVYNKYDNSALQLVAVMGQSYNLHASNQKVFRCSPSEVVKRPTDIRWNNDQWQNPERTGLFLYSAFYDRRLRTAFRDGHSFIRILAMQDTGRSTTSTNSTTYYCHIWLEGHAAPVVVKSEMREIWHAEWDNSGHSAYRPYLLSCILPRKYDKTRRSKMPAMVSVSDKPCTMSSTYVTIQHFDVIETATTWKSKKNFVVCVKPIDFSSDFSRKLIEWMEMNLLLGIDDVQVYKFKAHPNVEKVLKFYVDYGVMRVTTMTLAGDQPNYPVERSSFLKRNLWQKRRNELLPYNDCFYRHLYSHLYVLPIDVDELIVPREHDDLRQLMDYLKNSNEHRDMLRMYASFSVRNAYFFESTSLGDGEQQQQQQQQDVDVDHTYFLKHTVRSANFSLGGKSTKSLVRTDAALTVFNHYVLDSLLPGVGRSHEIPVQLVQMNHYRSTCPADMSNECKNNFLKYTQQDTVLWKYKERALNRFNQVSNLLNLNV